ncbi:helix-turn-helix domain-containing protein [Flavobacterium crassostreae]|uniref:HTH araC/xylS-type domain-containing protein n=1 Tax=Flavobacterium crassostreae TaxID=1763534 RepID=A0A1B9E9N7_9FLAO|nr:AraC family transcriptional regulator [Flavobacterium crassostreae]OCB78652.1 hypothetical protein LPBF_01265 [Flavobacterium crassostreae]
MNPSYDKIHDTLSFFGIDNLRQYYVSTGNQLKAYPNHAIRMDYYCLCLCYQGSAEVFIDNKIQLIHSNEIIATRPATIIQFINESEDFKIKFLFFEKNFLVENASNSFFLDKIKLFRGCNYHLISVNATQRESWLDLLAYLENKTEQESAYIEEKIRTIIYYLLLETADIFNQNKDKDTDKQKQLFNDLYFKFCDLVNANVTANKQLDFYAKTLCVTTKHLIEEVKKTSGTTPGKIINEALIQEAYILMNNPTYNITQIAFKLHFSSTASFSRFFKRISGISPRAYQQKNLR